MELKFKIVENICSVAERLNESFQKETEQVDKIQDSQYIYRINTLISKTTPRFIILSIITLISLTLLKIQFTSIIPAIIIPIALPLTSVLLSILPAKKIKNTKHQTIQNEVDKITQEMKHIIKRDKIKRRMDICKSIVNKINTKSLKPITFKPQTLKEANATLKELRQEIKKHLDKMDKINTDAILYNRFIDTQDEYSGLINTIYNTCIIGIPGIIYSLIMILFFKILFPFLIGTPNIPFIIFTIIAILGGIVANTIVNKNLENETKAFTQINNSLSKQLNLQDYKLTPQDVERLNEEAINRISNLIIQIEYLKNEARKLSPNTSSSQEKRYSYKFNPLQIITRPQPAQAKKCYTRKKIERNANEC